MGVGKVELPLLLDTRQFEVIARDDATRLRTWLTEQVKQRNPAACGRRRK